MTIPSLVRDVMIGIGVFLAPVCVVTAMYWESARPFVYVTPEEAEGCVLVFDAKG